MEDTLYISQNSYQQIVYDFIVSEEYKTLLEHTTNGNEVLFKDGFIFGLCWASMLTCKAKKLDLNCLVSNMKEYLETKDCSSTEQAVE